MLTRTRSVPNKHFYTQCSVYLFSGSAPCGYIISKTKTQMGPAFARIQLCSKYTHISGYSFYECTIISFDSSLADI